MVEKVSVHGGHSGQFCHHARDSLEAVVKRYVEQGFSWVGITEHMPPLNDALRYPDEQEAGLSSEGLTQQFRRYFEECRRLAEEYRDRITVYTAFETETYPGAFELVERLMAELRPDYLVGSVHHVGDICIDYDAGHYRRAVARSGGIEALYCDYFDAQHAMLNVLSPSVVGHFDLIRIHDEDYANTLQAPEVRARITRNLELIREQDAILDFNLRGYDKSLEQYPSRQVLEEAVAMGVAIVPGDDSHGVASVGRHYEQGVALLQQLGVSTDWQKPRLIEYGNRT